MKRILALLAAWVAMPVAFAHHSFGTNYLVDKSIEIEGTIKSVAWQNPHVKLTVVADAGTAKEKLWNIETHSISNLSRMHLDKSVIVIGQKVKMAGMPGRSDPNLMFLTHMLMADGREVIFQQGEKPLYSQKVVGTSELLRGGVGATDPAQRPKTIFSVWTTDYANTGSWPVFPVTSKSHPLNADARKKMAAFDWKKTDPLANCAPKGMPSAMAQPYPIQLIDAGDKILLKIEEYDATREIFLRNIPDPKGIKPSNLGYSTGRWEGDTLVVTTTHISYGYMDVLSDPKPIPQSANVKVVETFKLRAGGSFLDYTITITDPATLTTPVTFKKYWQFRPGAKIDPYSCNASAK